MYSPAPIPPPFSFVATILAGAVLVYILAATHLLFSQASFAFSRALTP